MKIVLVVFLLATSIFAQTSKPAADPLKVLAFLEGTWDANAHGNAGAAANGFYTFQLELGNHILSRQSHTGNCKGPAGYDCEHRDLLYVYAESPRQALKAIYFDSEGHVIHYDVSTPNPTTVIFLSDRSQSGPQFQLTYTLKDSVMTGSFQVRMPGQDQWHSYLEWTGGRR